MTKPFCRKPGPLEFTWDYCSLCDTMYVRCPKCGNNCCNASFGRLKADGTVGQHGNPDTVPCDTCNLAYQFQHLAWRHKDHPELPDEEKERKRKEYADAIDSLFGS